MIVMAERRMLFNSTKETFIGTMRIEYHNENSKLYLNLNNNIKIIEEDFDNDGTEGYYVIGFKKDLIIPENFINSSYYHIHFYSDYNIIFNTRSIYGVFVYFHGNFIFNTQSIITPYIALYDHNYIFNDNCFNVDGYINFNGRTIPQYYKHTNDCNIYAYPHILYDLMKYNNIEEGDEKAQQYGILYNNTLIISSRTEYIGTTPNVDLGNNNFIYHVSSYIYNENYITEYVCISNITYLRNGITLPKDATIYFPDTVTDISNDFDTGNVAFIYESNLKKVIIFGNCELTYLGGFSNSSLENIEIYTNTIQTIESESFNNTKLKNIIIPNSVTTIKSWSFYNCDKLESIIIPDNVESVGIYNFSHCDNLKNVYIGKKLINAERAFDSLIENITIDNNNLEIDKLFYNIDSLKNINVNYDNPNYSSINGILFNKNNDSILLYPHSRETTYVIPEGIINIGTYAFNSNPYITCITIPGSINIVKQSTFLGCSKLKTFIIKHGVIGIERVFITGNNTIEIQMPKTIESFDVAGLSDKTVSIYYEGSIEEYFNINFDQSGVSGYPKYNINLYIQNKLITELTIPNNITSLSNYNFIGHNSIATINVPKSVTSFGYKSFYAGVTTDTIINYEGTEEEWKKIYKSQGFINRNLTINYLCEILPANEIWYTSTDSNIIDVDTEYINNELLSNTYEDKGKLVFKNAINNINYLFEDKTQLKEVWLPNYNISSNISAFANCTELIQVNNSKQLKNIDVDVFCACTNLQEIEIDSSSIQDTAFFNCTSLNYVKISKRVESISIDAFSGCTSLNSINYEGTIEEWNNIDIDNLWCQDSAITTIHCSDGDIQL